MLTEEQRQLRKRYIGSSDAAAIVGVDPYRTAADVWYEKSGLLDEREPNENMQRGNFLERAIIDWAEVQIGKPLDRNVFKTSDEWPILCANLDAKVMDEPHGVEGKSSVLEEEWGELGTDEMPERVIVQAHHQMLVAGLELVYVPVLIPVYRKFDFRMYVVKRDDALANHVGKICTDFWANHVTANVCPPMVRPSIETLKRIHRLKGEAVPVDGELVTTWQRANQAAIDAKKRAEELKADVIRALGQAEIGEFEGGRITYSETTRRGYTVEETTFRQLRFKAVKQGE